MSWSGTVRCSKCWTTGHNKRSCPDLKKAIEVARKADPENWQVKEFDELRRRGRQRTCKYCKESGHNRATCKALVTDQIKARQECSEWRTEALEAIEAMGLGVGALVTVDGSPALVMGIQWCRGSQRSRVRRTAESMIEIKAHGPQRYNRAVPFPQHPNVSPDSSVILMAPAPGDTFARTVPSDWITEEPPERIMRRFDPETW